MTRSLGWPGIARLGLVQFALGAVAALTTSTLNRVMVVEAAMPAALPAAFIAWHYLVQLSRPTWGHGADGGRSRAPYVIGGMGVLVLGSLVATDAAALLVHSPLLGILTALFAYTLIGAGVGACGTSVLAILAERVAPERRAAAAAAAWVLMILGIVVSAAVISLTLSPFSFQKLALIASGIGAAAFILTLVGVHRIDAAGPPVEEAPAPRPTFRAAVAETLADPVARRFTLFVFLSMLAYSAQELVLEPFAGIVFHLPPSGSAHVSSLMHGGALVGMLMMGALASGGVRRSRWMGAGVAVGCLGSAGALCLMAAAALAGGRVPLGPTAGALGVFNGVFTVSAVGSMIGLAGAAGGREGVRVGVWGAAQAVGFAIGGFLGALAVDLLRELLRDAALAFALVFVMEAGLFLSAAALALTLEGSDRRIPVPSHPSLRNAV